MCIHSIWKIPTYIWDYTGYTRIINHGEVGCTSKKTSKKRREIERLKGRFD